MDHVVHFVKLHVFMSLIPYSDVNYDLRLRTMLGFVFTPIHIIGVHVLVNVIYIYLRILVSNTISMLDDVRVF